MIHQKPKRSYDGLKKASQLAIILFAFVVLPCAAYLMAEAADEHSEKMRALSAPLSNATIIDGVVYDKKGRKQ